MQEHLENPKEVSLAADMNLCIILNHYYNKRFRKDVSFCRII